MVKFLDLFAQYQQLAPEIDAAIASTIRDAAFVGGSRVQAFEAAFARYQRTATCIGVANGTDALEIAIESLKLPPGSDILVPALTFVASGEAVTRSGHKVVFADVDPASYLVTPETLAVALTPNTRAIVAVHLYGQPCDMPALKAFADARGLKIVEDCAQAHGAESHGTRVGGVGDIGTFSFYPGKNLGAYGDGGAIVSNDPELAKTARMIANHGRIDKYDHVFEGRCSRLDGLQAAILSVKLPHLETWIAKRRAVAAQYRALLADLGELSLPMEMDGARHVYHLFVVRTKVRDALQTHLRQHGIETGIHYPIALPKLRAYSYLGKAEAPFNANTLDSEVLSLPMGEHLTANEVEQVAAAVRLFFGGR